jgi:hypothetical protein
VETVSHCNSVYSTVSIGRNEIQTTALVNMQKAHSVSKNRAKSYVIYLPAGTQNSKISLPGEKTFSVKWFNPREGGEMQDGNVTSVEGKGFQTIGNPPVETENDWVVVLQ